MSVAAMPPATVQCTLVGFCPELDWRPLSFVKPIPPNKVCNACGLVRKRTALLPCVHVLCESCYEQCAQDGLHICPLDGYEWQDEDDVDWKDFPQDQLLRREVKCWNAERGCQHVAAAAMITQHFHHECVHHSTCCPKCSTSVLCKDMCAHLRSGTCGSVTNPAFEFQLDQCDFNDESASPNSFREAFEKQVEELKGYLERMTVDINTHGDRLNEISHGMNTFRETLRQELANGIQNPESLTETLCGLAASNAEIKECLTTRSDAVNHLSAGICRLEKVLKDELSFVRVETAGKLLQITAALQEGRNQRKENGQKTLERITKVLHLTNLQTTWCEFFVTGVQSLQDKARRHGSGWFYNKQVQLRGYCLSPGLGFKREGGSLALHICIQMHKGDMDEVLQWPMENKIKLSVTHPSANTIRSIQVKPFRSDDYCQKPRRASNESIYFPEKSLDLADLLEDGFVEDDKLRVKWQLMQ